MKPNDIKNLKDAMHDWYQLYLTTEQVVTIAETDPEFIKEVGKFGVDTVNRGWFANMVGNYVGLKGRWPLNGDTNEYADAYFIAFRAGCEAKGIKFEGFKE